MNQSLTSLIDKLNRQLHKLDLDLYTVQSKKQELQQHIQHIEDQMKQTGTNTFIVNPITEISWLNFITQQQEKKEAVTGELKSYREIEHKLKEKIKRIQMELSMLTNYLTRQQTNLG